LIFDLGDYALDTDRRELRRGPALVALEPQVFDLLEYLIRNRERVVSRDDLLASVWGGRIVSDSALGSRINAARRAVGDDGEQQRLIKTLPRKGIRFVGAVREEQIALPDRPSIAVLPFSNMSGDPDQDYFAEGMAEEIITALSRCSWLFVIARNSSFTYKGRIVDVRQIGRDLGVRYVLEGSVRRAGERLRITGQLVDSASGVHIWADRFDGDAGDVFELQDRITESVVGAIEPKVQLAEIDRLRHKAAPDLNAYDLLLQAQALEYEFTEQSLAAALRRLEQALAIDPAYAPAMALAAYCYAERHNQGWTQVQEEDASEGLRLALRAVELGKNDADVLWKAGFAVRVLGADPQRAREFLDRSLQINPNSAIALATAAWNEVMLGNPGGAFELLRRAERLSPRDPRAWYMAGATAFAHMVAGQYEQAVGCARRALAHNPRFTRTLRVLAASLARLGRTESAGQVMQEILRIEPHLTLTKLRWRLRHMDESALSQFSEALRLAGLPE
jgi:TolB-like protein/tetratricopeptide (TPR) repeat protein